MSCPSGVEVFNPNSFSLPAKVNFACMATVGLTVLASFFYNKCTNRVSQNFTKQQTSYHKNKNV